VKKNAFYLSLSLPFSLFDNNAWVTSSLTASDSHYEQSNISMSGNALTSGPPELYALRQQYAGREQHRQREHRIPGKLRDAWRLLQ
jgi:outer membrane usher protein FimD/PapC